MQMEVIFIFCCQSHRNAFICCVVLASLGNKKEVKFPSFTNKKLTLYWSHLNNMLAHIVNSEAEHSGVRGGWAGTALCTGREKEEVYAY